MNEAFEHDLLQDAIVFLLAAVAIVPVFHRMRASPVIGYLVAGAAIGPYALGLVQEVEGSHQLAEFGIVFLLFTIGLELSLDRLRVMARYVFGLGSAQVAATGVAIGLAAWLLGTGWGAAAVIGGALALSSTAFVLQMLAERGLLTSRLGRIVLAVLLLQDLAVVPGIAIVNAVGHEAESLAWSLTAAGARALVATAAILLVGRFLMRPLYRVIAGSRSPELFAAATLLIVLGTAWGTAAAGASMALGAFLAGLMLAGTEYRHQIEADILPFRGILLGLFFMSIGMLIDLAFVAERILLVVGIAAALAVVKAVIVIGLARGFGIGLPLAINIALHLAQGGEFAFVLLTLAGRHGIVPDAAAQVLLASVALGMAATPVLAAWGRAAQRQLERYDTGGPEALRDEADELSDHVVIAGFGRIGQTVGRILEAQGQPYIAIDVDAAQVAAGRARGLPVFFGDASRDPVLRAAGIERARAALITLDDAEPTARVVAALRRRLPDLPIVARARDREQLRVLHRAGASAAFPELAEASLQLGRAVLEASGFDAERAEDILDGFRRNDYAALGDIVEPKRPVGAEDVAR